MIDTAVESAATKPDYRLPMPTRAPKHVVCEYAEKQRAKANLRDGFQLAALIPQIGGKIEYIDFFDDDQVDAIIIEPDDSFVIRVSSYTGALRDNFTIAHELGHRLLHWPIIKRKFPGEGMRATRKVDDNDKALMRCEWEANWFASSFLMPEKEFREAYEAGIASERFGVTEAAVDVRRKTLSIGG